MLVEVLVQFTNQSSGFITYFDYIHFSILVHDSTSGKTQCQFSVIIEVSLGVLIFSLGLSYYRR